MFKILQALKIWAHASWIESKSGPTPETMKLDEIAARLYKDGLVRVVAGVAIAAYILIGLALAATTVAFVWGTR